MKRIGMTGVGKTESVCVPAGGEQAVDVPIRVGQGFLMVDKAPIEDLLRHTFFDLFAQHVAGGAVFSASIIFQQEYKEFMLGIHVNHP